MSNEIDLLCSGLHLMDEAVHGKASRILLTYYDPAQQKDLGAVGYCQGKQLLAPIPAEFLPPDSIPEEGDFFLVSVPRAERQLHQKHEAEPQVKDVYIALRFATHHLWEKVQLNQEEKKAPGANPFQLLVTAEEMIACCDSQGQVTLAQLKVMMDVGFSSLWEQQSDFFIRAYGNELSGRWRCKRTVEATAVAWVAVNIHELPSILSFLKKLKLVADAKTKLPS